MFKPFKSFKTYFGRLQKLSDGLNEWNDLNVLNNLEVIYGP
jgi:hypothetical protein